MVRARAVCEDFDSIEGPKYGQRVAFSKYLGSIHVDVRCLGSEQFFTCLGRQGCVIEGQYNIANRDLAIALVFLEPRRKIVLLNMPRSIPRSEKSVLSEVSVPGSQSFLRVKKRID